MALKDLFGKKSSKPIPSKNFEQLKEDTESSKLLEKKALDDNTFQPRVDFSDPANFAFYGSALKYYQDSFSNIQDQYPYDGSKAEKIEWRLSASYLDKYMYDNLYPRKVGKGHARLAFKKACEKEDPIKILLAVKEFAEVIEGKEKQFIPHPTTWLNGERWDDDIEDVAPKEGTNTDRLKNILQWQPEAIEDKK